MQFVVSKQNLQKELGFVESTPRTITNHLGTVIARNDYLPFGEDVPNNVGLRTSGQGYGVTTAARQKYAGMESNPATGLAHTLWRQYDSLSGRWTSPDPYRASVSIANPQSFNRYSYVDNDPINQVDPDGLMGQVADASMGWGSVSGGFWGDSPGIGIRSQNHIAEAEARLDSINLTGWDPAFGFYWYVDLVRGHGEHSTLVPADDTTPTESQESITPGPLEQRGRRPPPPPRRGSGRGMIPWRPPVVRPQRRADPYAPLGFRGLNQNRPLRELTHQEIYDAFKGTPFELTNHAIMRLRDPRTEALGIKTLNDYAKSLNMGLRCGNITVNRGSTFTVTHRRFQTVINYKEGRIVTIKPE